MEWADERMHISMFSVLFVCEFFYFKCLTQVLVNVGYLIFICCCRRRRCRWWLVVNFFRRSFLGITLILFRRRIITLRHTTWIADTWNRTKVRIAIAFCTSRIAVCMQQQHSSRSESAFRRIQPTHRRSYPLSHTHNCRIHAQLVPHSIKSNRFSLFRCLCFSQQFYACSMIMHGTRSSFSCWRIIMRLSFASWNPHSFSFFYNLLWNVELIRVDGMIATCSCCVHFVVGIMFEGKHSLQLVWLLLNPLYTFTHVERAMKWL